MPFLVKEKVINKVVQIETEKILPNPYQPRRAFEDLDGLAQSIEQNGILQPLTVRRENGEIELVSGERRLRAAKLLGMETVPCIILEMSGRNSAVMALIENIQRQDLSVFDEAEAIAKLIDFYGMTQEDAAVRLGKSQSTVANKLRLLKLDGAVREKITEYGLTERHARALLKLPEERRIEAVEIVHSRNLNVESTERLIEAMLNKQREAENFRKRSAVFKDVRLFVNTINKAVEMMKAAGINADSKKIQQEDFIEYIVRIPTNKAEP
ncbi:MAG: ParB/RepB/Spo0J family partition protein [Ruminococcus sp.]|nr:ParB/RepB/Spo0J family partition protein [Ruminococcus sp.]MCM1381418.1 ParB/RepB/Spo0J family partition protein [Muribaculaceae bacterium]MCM1478702.1 ParB/RepB/Spo0J family partition protein [Muribaculaceae bacterium]